MVNSDYSYGYSYSFDDVDYYDYHWYYDCSDNYDHCYSEILVILGVMLILMHMLIWENNRLQATLVLPMLQNDMVLCP